MRLSYVTLRGEGVAEYEEKKSRFVGAAAPAPTEDAALAFLAAVRRRHAEASHNVYAYMCGEGGFVKRYGDDGEPKGTAGVPVLDVIEKSGLSDAVIVVTRYFGGILLGAAGLIRAYGKAASLAAASAGPVRKTLARQLCVLVEYPAYNIVRNAIETEGYEITGVAFGMDIEIGVTVPYGSVDPLCARLAELTAGTAVIGAAGDGYIDGPA